MNSCEYESWTLEELATALTNGAKEKRVIKVPLFQRSIVWNKNQQRMFIKSLEKGFPIGTLLFSKRVQDDKEIFTLIDGLQRSNTIKEFIKFPTQFIDCIDIDETTVNNINNILNLNGNQESIKTIIKETLIDFLKNVDDIQNVQFIEFAYQLAEKYPTLKGNGTKIKEISDAVKPFILNYKNILSNVSKSKIPIIIYSGDESNLPDIFALINNQGTALTKYQIYAASWSTEQEPIFVNNTKIVNAIINKYETMVNGGFTLENYNKEQLKKEKKFNIFEYVFGFGKYLSDEFPNLFEKDRKPEDISPIGFELINACFGNSSDEIKNLHQYIKSVDTERLEDCICDSVKIVHDILRPYIAFVGNKHKSKETPTKIFHARNQIISIIASVFLEKYDLKNLPNTKKTWKAHKKELTENIPLHYVNDIISRAWGEGGIGRIYTIINDIPQTNKYRNPIPKQSWELMLNKWFDGQINRHESKNVANPRLTDLLFLNCIYTEIFTAKEHLSSTYDVEHIATKDYMKSTINNHKWNGLPISCIANLCYLPEQQNRAKKDKNIYQDVKYLKKFSIKDVEEKFTFTVAEDLEWMDCDYSKEDYDEFSTYYLEYLKKRFEIQKTKFYKSMNIN